MPRHGVAHCVEPLLLEALSVRAPRATFDALAAASFSITRFPVTPAAVGPRGMHARRAGRVCAGVRVRAGVRVWFGLVGAACAVGSLNAEAMRWPGQFRPRSGARTCALSRNGAPGVRAAPTPSPGNRLLPKDRSSTPGSSRFRERPYLCHLCQGLQKRWGKPSTLSARS